MGLHAYEHCVVVGLGASGLAAARLLRRASAEVSAFDEADTPSLRAAARELGRLGIRVELGVQNLPARKTDLVVVSPGVPESSPLLRAARRTGAPVIGELELGYRHSRCLNVAITGTNGKTTTTELVVRVLEHAHRHTLAAGNIGRPFCEVAEQTAELDFVTLEVSSFQLETIEFFRPTVAVLLNVTPDHLDRYATMADYLRAKARIFMNQQGFDWAIIQSEALAQMHSLGLGVPGKTITFSANDSRADLGLDRSLIVSRMAGWEGPLLDLATCQVRGPHNAENFMAALAVGRVLRIPLPEMRAALQSYQAAPHRCEEVGERGGIRFFNDSKATNPDAMHKALLAMPGAGMNEPNVLLIAGGKDKGLEYHDLGPILARRVKHIFLIGETREKLRAAWSLFAPCTLAESLLEAVPQAARHAVAGDVVLLSPGCSSFDQFRNYQHRGDVFREAVLRWMQQPGGSRAEAGPDIVSQPMPAAAVP